MTRAAYRLFPCRSKSPLQYASSICLVTENSQGNPGKEIRENCYKPEPWNLGYAAKEVTWCANAKCCMAG
ncbi:hypothetical protein BDV32DRAFT_117608 [Aspergillus pseudonomiae]|nr:hypothetical protein BDV32DRAFT_117608 [Aspergillus pseudonomiae]